jgi:hypothetical protein
MKNLITFSQVGSILDDFKEVLPYSNLNKIPEWYRKINFFSNENNRFELKNGTPQESIKACVPFFDAITSGYTIPTWADIYVENSTDNEKIINWMEGLTITPIDGHGHRQFSGVPIPEEYDKNMAFKWINLYHIKTPPGYSCLFLSPFFQKENNFWIIPGIVDTDKYDNIINFPFFLKNNFEGIISAGTPMVQVFPFKREEWKMKIKSNFEKEKSFADEKRQRKFINFYRKKFWVPKKYE